MAFCYRFHLDICSDNLFTITQSELKYLAAAEQLIKFKIPVLEFPGFKPKQFDFKAKIDPNKKKKRRFHTGTTPKTTGGGKKGPPPKSQGRGSTCIANSLVLGMSYPIHFII